MPIRPPKYLVHLNIGIVQFCGETPRKSGLATSARADNIDSKWFGAQSAQFENPHAGGKASLWNFNRSMSTASGCRQSSGPSRPMRSAILVLCSLAFGRSTEPKDVPHRQWSFFCRQWSLSWALVAFSFTPTPIRSVLSAISCRFLFLPAPIFITRFATT